MIHRNGRGRQAAAGKDVVNDGSAVVLKEKTQIYMKKSANVEEMVKSDG